MLKKAMNAFLRRITNFFAGVSMVFLWILYQLLQVVWCIATLIMIMASMLYHRAFGALYRKIGGEYDWVEQAKEAIESFRSILDRALGKFK